MPAASPESRRQNTNESRRYCDDRLRRRLDPWFLLTLGSVGLMFQSPGAGAHARIRV
jgi:hypothetical protein